MSERKQRSRSIPWPNVVRFHKEIAARAESSFFSLNGRDAKAERWTSLKGFEPEDVAGPWHVDARALVSDPFRLALDQGSHETMFIGGPCYLGWEKGMKGGWMPQWRPILYREVKVSTKGSFLEISPEQGHWYLSPLVCSLIDRLQVSAGDDLDAFARELVEAATARQEGEGSMGEAIIETLIGRLPDLEEPLRKMPRSDTFEQQPSSWVLFAPTSNFSALTRYLMADYNRLEKLLEVDPKNIGGLEVLDDSISVEKCEVPPILPVTLLNKAQQRAVENILGNEALSVVSGPPGCGKSQVVVSVLLNAWASGKSVLFASNNNSAVDVVRARLERFESEFPIAVRAGNRQKNNVVELLRKALNYASGSNATEDQHRSSEAKRRKLSKERAALQESLDGKVPQRAAEGLRTALNAYGAYQKILEEASEKEAALKKEWETNGYKGIQRKVVEAQIGENRAWLERAEHYKGEQQQDSRRLKELEHELVRIRRKRDEIVGRVGLDASEVNDWSWLENGPAVSLVSAWEDEFQAILTGQQEEALEPFEWDSAFDRWDSANSARNTRDRAQEHAQTIRRQMAELAPRVSRISQLRAKLEKCREALVESGLEEKSEIATEILSLWSAEYSDFISRQAKRSDFLPWSERSKIKRRLKKLEVVIRPFIPLSKWREIGAVDAEGGRDKLSEVVETLRVWKEALDKWEGLEDERNEVDATFEQMRADSGGLGLGSIPEDESQSGWNRVADEADTLGKLADRAAAGIEKKHAKESALRLIQAVVRNWRNLASGQPIKEWWMRGQGVRFVETLDNLQKKPSPQTLTEIRGAYYSGNLSELKRTWEEATHAQVEVSSTLREIENVPKPEDRVKQWFSEQPSKRFLPVSAGIEWPDLEELLGYLGRAEDLCSRVEHLENEVLPTAKREASKEKVWANEQLLEAIEVLPATGARSGLEEIYKDSVEDSDGDWPVEQISEAFQDFSPEIIKAKISQIDAELEKGSFEDSKTAWLKRLQDDDDAVDAVDQLEKTMRRNNGKISEEHFELFRRSLRVVPIWITTAQAAQAIPLEPKLFDLVVIDEASQCTLTNLLPLLYRGKRLAIIGDSEQLPAIPTVQDTEELTLAKKFEVEPFLSIIGHASNDVYSAAADALPRGRAGVLNLDEHFRSNPQIIGFSNRHIYQQRLVLKTDPSKGRSMPVGSGVHKRHVSGRASRGERGRSWQNMPEAQEVMGLIRSLRSDADMQHYSIGVVTPFSAQKELLRNLMESEGIASKILVDSAYGFQGDERDIIIFSPVVAGGITSSASKWVESPPNLINVALTRARQALFVVADFDYCLQQEPSGILRKLADYCNDVQTLRDTSPAELELYSWMIVEAWTPEIHPRIGDVEVDFSLCSKGGVRLAIEVDGAGVHNDRKTVDQSRDSFLQAQGWKVLRVPARAILETPHSVIEKIKGVLQLDVRQ
jgi:hypothetical protein